MISGLHSVVLWTDNVPRLLAFYRDTLGLEVGMESDEFAIVGKQIGIGKHSEISGRAREPLRIMLDLAVDDCQAEYQRLKAKGVEFVREPSEDPGGFVIATFTDADGNMLQLFQAPEGGQM